MKKFTVVLIVLLSYAFLSVAQKVEKKIVSHKVRVTMPLTTTAAAQQLADPNVNALKNKFLQIINNDANSRTDFEYFGNRQLTIADFTNRAVIVLSNVSPQRPNQVPQLVALDADITQNTADILAEMQKYVTNLPANISFESANKANTVILAEIKDLDLEPQWSQYRAIQTVIFSKVDRTLPYRDANENAITDAVTRLRDIRLLRIKAYKDLFNGTFDISDHAHLTILHSKDGVTWDDDPTGVRRIMIVVIDGNQKLSAASFHAENFKSAVAIEFNELIGFIKEAGLIAMGPTIAIPIPALSADVTYLELNRGKIDPPGNIVSVVPYMEDGETKRDSIKVRIKEKVRVSFKVGVSTAMIDRKIFKLDSGQLIIKLDSAKKEEWKQHLMVTFNLNPWYRTGDYDPKMFRYDADNSFLKRASAFFGMNLSLAPFDNLYFGLAYDLSKNFTINGGVTLNNTLQNGKIDVGNMSSVKDALKLSNKEYGPAKWFVALTFRPAVIRDILAGDDK